MELVGERLKVILLEDLKSLASIQKQILRRDYWLYMNNISNQKHNHQI